MIVTVGREAVIVLLARNNSDAFDRLKVLEQERHQLLDCSTLLLAHGHLELSPLRRLILDHDLIVQHLDS